MSRKIELQGLSNTRDLGGMRGADGRFIASSRLIRSGQLYNGTAEDIRYFSDHVSLVVDFRTEDERDEKPDPAIKNVANLSLPIHFDNIVSNTKEHADPEEETFSSVVRDPEKAKQFMIRAYANLIANYNSISQYGQFLKLLIKKREKAVLWHCIGGKDRAGLAAVIVQEALGVDRRDIYTDYLKTNQYLADEIAKLSVTISHQLGGMDEKIEKSLHYLFGTEEEYLDTVYQKISETYGDYQRFLTTGLNINTSECEILRNNYLV